MDTVLEVSHLYVEFETEYGTARAVRDLSLKLAEGEIFALVGESGCGKSVFCKSLLKLLPRRGRIVSGEIWHGGKNLAVLSEREMLPLRGREIAMIFQNPMSAFNPSATVGSQIAESVKMARKIGKKQAREKAVELMRLTGIPEPEKRYHQAPVEFSGGMLQRAAIAAALAGSPKLLIADEPTTALDVTVQAEILKLLLELRKSQGLSILLITHDLGVAEKLADRIGVMYAGKLIEVGKTEEILRESRHPYTWGLLGSLPQKEGGRYRVIDGAPPDMTRLPKGDAFASRNPYAMAIDYREEPPIFQVSETHFAATWLLHPKAMEGTDETE